MRLVLSLLLLSLLPASAHARLGAARMVASAGLNGDGWLQQCWSNFTVTNILTQSNSFTTSPWTASSSGGPAAPTLTANTTDVTSPDGTNDATKMVIPAVSSPSQTSYIIQFPQPNGYNPGIIANETLWMRGASGGEKTYLEWDDTGSGQFFIPVTLSTNWQLYTLPIIPTTTFGTPFVGNTSRTGMVSTAAATIYIWHAQVNLSGVPYSYVPTTTSSGTTTIKAACPPNIRFRDFRNLTYSTSFQPLLPKGSNTWNSAFHPTPTSLRSWQLINGTYYGIFYGNGGGGDATCAPGCYLNEYTGPDIYHLSDPGGINPIVSPVTSTWIDHYVYAGNWAPITGINGSTYGLYVSARNSSQTDGMGLFSASNPTGPWTAYGSNPLFSGYLTPTLLRLPNGLMRLDTFLQGGFIQTQTSTNGLTFSTGAALSISAPSSGDWDSGYTVFGEQTVFQNQHGFCEMMLGEFGPIQEGVYAIAASCDPTVPAGQIWYRTPFNPGLTYPARSFSRNTTGFGCASVVDPHQGQGDFTVLICGVDSTLAPSPDGGTWHSQMPAY